MSCITFVNRLKDLIKKGHHAIFIKVLYFMNLPPVAKREPQVDFLVLFQYEALLCYIQAFHRNHEHLPF